MAKMPAQKQITPAYLAGIIDGEGCVNINRHKSKTSRLGYRFDAHISISNTNLNLLKDIQKFVGAGTIRKKTVHKSNRKQGYEWGVYSQQIKLLRACIPFLRIKYRQAVLLLKYIDKHNFIPGPKGLSLIRQRDQMKCWRRIRQLNRRGTTDV